MIRDYTNYLQADDDTKRTMQRMLFLDYLEEVTVWNSRHPEEEELELMQVLYEGMKEYEDEENYEMCQLYKDVLENILDNDSEFRRVY